MSIDPDEAAVDAADIGRRRVMYYPTVRAATVADTDRMFLTHVVTPEGLRLLRAGLDAFRDADSLDGSRSLSPSVYEFLDELKTAAAMLSDDLANAGALVIVRIVPA